MSVNKWLSVKTNRPPVGETVLVYIPSYENEDRLEGPVQTALVERNGFSFADREYYYFDVSHWMPLPEEIKVKPGEEK